MKMENVVQEKEAKFAQMRGNLNNSFKQTPTQISSRSETYKALILPILLYGKEIWTLRQKIKKSNWHQSR